MRKSTMRKIASVVADEMASRGANQKDAFITNVAANVCSTLAVTLVTTTFSALAKAIARPKKDEVDAVAERMATEPVHMRPASQVSVDESDEEGEEGGESEETTE